MGSRGEWIRGLRRHIGANQVRFAEIMGVAQATVSRWETGAEPEIVHWEALRELAAKYNYGLLASGTTSTVPLVGYVGAGAVLNLYGTGQGPFDEVDMPPGGNEQTVAVEVRGDSMTGIADDHWIIYYHDRPEPPHDGLFGKLCVIGLANDGVVIKKLLPGRQPGRFDLYSNNAAPILDQEVIWATKVEWIKPR